MLIPVRPSVRNSRDDVLMADVRDRSRSAMQSYTITDHVQSTAFIMITMIHDTYEVNPTVLSRCPRTSAKFINQ
jgi:hypothetical protein